MRSSLCLLAIATAAVACSGGSGDESSGASGGGGGSEHQGGNATGSGGAGSTGSDSAGSTGSGGHEPVDVTGPFRHGVNFGYVAGFDDPQMATLARRAGANSARLSFPERHLTTWGYDIEVSDNEAYQTIGIKDNVAFLGGCTAEHSTAPAGTPEWELDHYIPKHLYEPIFTSSGEVNEENYWASYVSKTVSTYKDYVKIWSVWNEPDWTSDWGATQTWDTEPPTKDQLPRFGGSIYDYVRMLRITTEVAKKADPEARVAVGGLGYPGFLSAILRYTDNPDGGAVSADYPATGAAYFDVVDMHYYPLYTPGSSDQGASGLLGLRGEFQAALDAAGAGPRGWIVTETGAPHQAYADTPSGAEYARNYLLKAMTLAQASGVSGVDWFILSDATTPSGPYDSMGLYGPLSGITVDTAALTDTGKAYATLGGLLDDGRYDPEATLALALPAEVRGPAFRVSGAADAKRALVLWAATSGSSEQASATYELGSTSAWRAYSWDASQRGLEGELLSPTAGALSLALTGSPEVLIEEE